MSFIPRPLDTSKIKMDDSLNLLLERLAENTHDAWAALRLQQGWTYGAHRDDSLKKHPGLVPYDELPESEREYDRQTAMQTLKAILLLGYKIENPVETAQAKEGGTQALLQTLKAAEGQLRLLRSIWESRQPEQWTPSPQPYCLLAQILCKKGEAFWAYDVATTGLSTFPRDTRLRQMQAWAIAQTGAPHAAEKILERLRTEGKIDSETMGLLGRVYKDFAGAASSDAQRREFLEKSLECYLDGFLRTQDSYNGINAATLTLWLAQTEAEKSEAHRLARETERLCRAESSGHEPSAWAKATLAEACLVQGRLDEAGELYSDFASEMRNDPGMLQSSRRQARLVLESLGADKSLIDRWMPLPPIVIFAGHMIDQPDRPQPRFPEVDCPIVLAHIETRLEACAARVGYSSAACGADILFLEAMKMRGGETHIVLPCSIESFRKQSVRRIGGESWVARFDQAIKDATTLTFSGLHDYTESPAVFEFANRELFGLARLKSRLWEIGLAPLAVWNGESGDGPGGTSACLKMWTTSGLAVDIIPVRKTETDDSSLSKTVASEGSQEIKAILFADVVGYSQLPERDTPRYGTLFLGGLARLLGSLSKPPLAQNTWGDAVYLVFESTAEAGECALRLRRFIQSTDWQKEGLSRPLNIRIGLHAGPVFPVHDFITGRRGYMGAHVNRAARIEPVAAEGQIYASEPFAALAETEKTSLFSCVYVGEKALPKDAGIIRVYSLIDRAG